MLTWNYNETIGECKVKSLSGEIITIKLYEGNALLIGIYESVANDGKKVYKMCFFFVDKEHLKNMENDKEFWEQFVEFEFYNFKNNVNTICKVLAKQKIKFTVSTKSPF